MIESLYAIPFVGHLNKITDKKKENTWNKKRNWQLINGKF